MFLPPTKSDRIHACCLKIIPGAKLRSKKARLTLETDLHWTACTETSTSFLCQRETGEVCMQAIDWLMGLFSGYHGHK